MINAFSSITNYGEHDWEDYLTKLALISVFNELIKEYGHDKVKLTCAIKFIVYAYSVESEKAIVGNGNNWQKNKQRIFEDTCTPTKDLYEDLVLFKNERCINTIHKWLDFQDNDVYSELMMLKDLRMEMMISATTDIRKSSGEIDYDQKNRNSIYASELRKRIKDLESEFVQNNVKLKDAVKEFNNAPKAKNTFGVEKFAI